jgi:hypothetical protein
MFGDNFDIPSFRWYDKDLKKLFVSGKDAAALNARYAKGHGLMRGGSSINNLLNGDAEKSILTMADLRAGEPDEKKRRAEDIYLLMLNPYFVMRTIVLFVGDMIREVWEYRRDKAQGVQPLLNRVHHFYPAMRAATTTFMRDVAAYLVILDIVRGSPSIYVTWPGYDEVAHHSLPWSKHAFRTLRQYDRVIARVRDIIARKAPRPYELLVLSDHGQSTGHTFLQRYGYTLKEFIERQLPQGVQVAHSTGGDDGTLSMVAMAGELQNVQQQGVGGTVGTAVVKRTEKALDRGVAEQAQAAAEAEAAQVTVCGSGNIAQVYFDLYPRKIKLSEMNAAYPGLVDGLVQHEGVGFVVSYDDAGAPIVLGKGGSRHLHTGVVQGDDPLKPYGDVNLRAAQVRRIADFPHAGDLIVNSTLFPDGTVAAMEELIGNHGGMGGEQTDAFILHPDDLQVPPTTNSADVFKILDSRRGLPPASAKPKKAAALAVDSWSLSTLIKGIGRGGRWIGRAARAFVLDRSAYKEVAQDPFMTGPSLAIGVLATVMALFVNLALNAGVARLLPLLAQRVAVWVIAALLVFGAGRIMAGKASFTAIFRVIGFAQVAYLFDLLAFIPGAAPLARLLTWVWLIFATWIGSAEALELRGWRGVILPLVVLGTLIVTVLVLQVLVAGAAFTLRTLAQELGLIP